MGGVTAEERAAAYDDGWTMAVFATSPEDMSGEAQLLRALEYPPADNPHRDGPRSSRLAIDRAVVARELALAVDGTTTGVVTWARVVDSLVESGALLDLPADGAATVLAAIEELLESPAVRAADGNGGESFVSVSAVRAVLASLLPQGGCGDPDCDDCRTQWGRP